MKKENKFLSGFEIKILISFTRQLLTGVDNLRMMASALESLDKSNEHTEGYLSDCGNDDDDCTGPAL